MVHLVHQSLHVVCFTAMRIQELESHLRVPQSKTPNFFFTEVTQKRGTRNWNLTNTFLSILVIYSISMSGRPSIPLQAPFQTVVSHPRSSCGTVIIPIIAMVCRTLTARPEAMAANWRDKAWFFEKVFYCCSVTSESSKAKSSTKKTLKWQVWDKVNCQLWINSGDICHTRSLALWTFQNLMAFTANPVPPRTHPATFRNPERSQNLCPHHYPF